MKLDIMKEKDNRFYGPVFAQIAEILDNDYNLYHDSTGSALDLSFSVMHKKYKWHGLYIGTHLNSNPEWTIKAYCRLPFNIGQPSKYEFTPERDDENFPILTNNQLSIIETKIKAIHNRTLMDIEDLGKELENGTYSFDIDNVYVLDKGTLDFSGLKNYDINIDYEKYLTRPYVDMRKNYQMIIGVINSKDPMITKYTETVIDLYISECKKLTMDKAWNNISKLRSDVLEKFTQKNIDNYIFMVTSFVEDGINIEQDMWTIKALASVFENFDSVPNATAINDTIMCQYYNETGDTHFLPNDIKDIFFI